MIEWDLRIDTAGQLTYTLNVSNDLMSVDVEYGRRDRLGVAEPATLTVVLKSTTGKYYMDHPNRVSGLAPGRAVRLQAVVQGQRFEVFRGRIEDITPELVDDEGGMAWRTHIFAIDQIRELGMADIDISVRKNRTLGALARIVLEQAGWKGPIVVQGAVSHGPSFAWFEDVTVLQALDEITEAEAGTFHIDRHGRAVYRGRRVKSLLFPPSSRVDLTDQAYGWHEESLDTLVTRVVVIANRIRQLKLKKVWENTKEFVMKAKGTRTYNVDFMDPVTKMVKPQKTTDYRAVDPRNDARRDAQLAFKITGVFTTGARFRLRNTFNHKLRITKLQVRGTPLKWLKVRRVKVSRKGLERLGLFLGTGKLGAPTSKLAGTVQGHYLPNKLVVDNRLVQQTTAAQSLAKHLVDILGDPQPRVNIDFLAKTEAQAKKLIELDIDHRVKINHPPLGIDGDYFVDHLSISHFKGDALRVSAMMSPAFDVDPNRLISNNSFRLGHSQLTTVLDLSGTGDVGVGNFFNLGSGDSASWEGWVQPDAHTGTIVSKKGGTGTVVGWRVGIDGSSQFFAHIADGGTSAVATGSPKVIDGSRWYHVAAVLDRSSQRLRLYVNGTLEADVSTSSVGTLSNSSTLFLGRLDGGTPLRLDGRLHDVRYWNYARTREEIISEMVEAKEGNEADANEAPLLRALWLMVDGAPSTTVYDFGPSSRHGTISGGHTWSELTVSRMDA